MLVLKTILVHPILFLLKKLYSIKLIENGSLIDHIVNILETAHR